jgi:hypothetical protein
VRYGTAQQGALLGCPNVAHVIAEKEQAVSRQNLTDRFIKSQKKASAGTRIDYQDTAVSGLALRVTDRGHKSFVLVARYPSQPKNPTRRALGDCYIPKKGEVATGWEIRHGALTLAEARRKAREWLDLISRGIDPRVEEERQRAAQQRRQANTFAAVAAISSIDTPAN